MPAKNQELICMTQIPLCCGAANSTITQKEACMLRKPCIVLCERNKTEFELDSRVKAWVSLRTC